jgi:hypothetical protein
MKDGGDRELAQRLQTRVAKHFTIGAMTDGVLAAYADARAHGARQSAGG